MINPSNTLIIVEKNHPLIGTIKEHFEVKSPEEALASFETFELIVDLTALRTKNKILLLKELAKTTKSKIISDLTLSWGEMILKNFPQVIGAVSTAFFSPTNSIEYFGRTEADKKTIEQFLSIIGKKGVHHTNLKIGFHYPRVISMIINEAFFALEENLASKTDIDLAMKNGVSYPLGPLEWSEKIGAKNIVDLLTEYLEITGEDRYRISKELKIAATSF